MKIIISYQSGNTEIISISSIEELMFSGEYLQLVGILGNRKDIHYREIRSIVIA